MGGHYAGALELARNGARLTSLHRSRRYTLLEACCVVSEVRAHRANQPYPIRLDDWELDLRKIKMYHDALRPRKSRRADQERGKQDARTQLVGLILDQYADGYGRIRAETCVKDALRMAARNHLADIVTLILKRTRTSPSICDKYGRTLLMEAVRRCSSTKHADPTTTIERLISATVAEQRARARDGHETSGLDAVCDKGNTALHLLCRDQSSLVILYGHNTVARLVHAFLDAGADPRIPNRDGELPVIPPPPPPSLPPPSPSPARERLLPALRRRRLRVYEPRSPEFIGDVGS